MRNRIDILYDRYRNLAVAEKKKKIEDVKIMNVKIVRKFLIDNKILVKETKNQEVMYDTLTAKAFDYHKSSSFHPEVAAKLDKVRKYLGVDTMCIEITSPRLQGGELAYPIPESYVDIVKKARQLYLWCRSECFEKDSKLEATFFLFEDDDTSAVINFQKEFPAAADISPGTV